MTNERDTQARSPAERAGRPSIILILPYFGRWPSYMDLWLRSCGANPDVDWLVVSDRDLPGEPPPNVRHLHTTLPALRDRISDAVGMRLCLPRPYKLCDFSFRERYRSSTFRDTTMC